MNNLNIRNFISKSLFIAGFIFLFAKGLKAEETVTKITALEQLWKLTIQNNIDIQAATRNQELSEYDFNHYWRKFLPSISVSSSSTFSDPSSESSKIPEVLTSSVTISENLPGGLSIGISPNVNLSRELTGGRVKMMEETKLSVSVSQKVLPYWLQKNKNKTEQKRIENPEKTIQSISQKLATTNSKILLLSTLEEITGNYIQYRIICRNIDSVEKRIELLQSICKTMQQMNQLGSLTLSDVFSKEEELNKYLNELQSYNNSKENTLYYIYKYFSSLENSDYLQNLLLPEKKLPAQIEPIFLENPTYEYLKLQKQNLETDHILSKQNASPVLSLNGTIPLHNSYDESNFMGAYQSSNAKKWSVSVSLNLSPLISNSAERIKMEYENNKKTNEEKIESHLNNLTAEIEMYEKLLFDSRKQLAMFQKSLEYYQSLMEAKKVLQKKGQISDLELYQTEIEIECKKNDIKNCEDNNWYYTWLIQNRLSGQDDSR